MDFEQIWPDFESVIDEMKEGMCFFEGYASSIEPHDLASKLSKLNDESSHCDFTGHIWADDTTEVDWESEHSLEEYEKRFKEEQIVLLRIDYEKKIEGTLFCFRLIFERNNNPSRISLEIICYREAIFKSSDPKQAIETAIQEFRHLRRLFEGDALFIGPDTLNYPQSKDDVLREWIRIE